MISYTRKQINVKAHLHGKQFVTQEDAEKAMVMLADAAVKAGADESKMMEFLRGNNENS